LTNGRSALTIFSRRTVMYSTKLFSNSPIFLLSIESSSTRYA